MMPYEEDQAVCAMAEQLGLKLSRFESIVIEDDAAVKAAGWMRQTPDYSRIRKALEAGATIPGVRMGGWEYKLRRSA